MFLAVEVTSPKFSKVLSKMTDHYSIVDQSNDEPNAFTSIQLNTSSHLCALVCA